MRRLRRKNSKDKLLATLALAAAAIFLCVAAVKILWPLIFKDSGLTVSRQENIASGPDKEHRFTVCLDPGHGEYDDGSTSITGVTEKEINLSVGLKLGKLLEDKDFNVLYTRKTDEVMGTNQKEDLKLRCDLSNNGGADIYVSIHCNFDKNSSSSKGLEAWCRFRGQEGEKLASEIVQQLSKADYTRNRGIKYEEEGSLYVLRNTKAPAVLVELGFLSNREDATYLQSEEGQNKCAEAMAQAISAYAAAHTEEK